MTLSTPPSGSAGYSDSAPRYLQIADLMRQRIARGTWPLGDKLPSLDALVEEFGVARVTMRQAMDVLAREGLVSPQQGRGTFVTARPPSQRWLKVETSLDELARTYRDDRPQIVSSDESLVSAPLQPEDGLPAERYVYMRRVHFKDGKPYCVINLYLDERIFRRNPKRFRSETVIPILNEMREGGVAHAHQVLTIATADMEVARLLQVPANTPVAEVRRVFTDAGGRVIYLGEVTYRGDFVQLQMKLK
jgi:GntR family transcriptional regulator